MSVIATAPDYYSKLLLSFIACPASTYKTSKAMPPNASAVQPTQATAKRHKPVLSLASALWATEDNHTLANRARVSI